jgi:WD40 repeat protein
VGCGIAAGLVLAFGVTIGLVVYVSVKSSEPAKATDFASGPQRERDEPPRLLDERGAERENAEHRRPAPSEEKPGKEEEKRNNRAAEDPPRDAPPTTLSKTLASMDKLTIALPAATPDEAPTPDVWDGHTASIRGVAFTDDGRFVVSVSGAIQKNGASKDNSIRVWDARRGKQVHKLDNFREELDAVSVSPGGRFAVFGHGGHYEGDEWIDAVDHRVHLWDIQDNREIYFRKGVGEGADTDPDKVEARFMGLDSSVFSTAFSPDRKQVVGAANSGKLVVWESQSGQSLVSGKLEAVARPRSDSGQLVPIPFTLRGINCVCFTPDGSWLLTGGGDYTVRLIDVATGEQLHNFESHQDIVWAVATTRMKDGRLLALSGGGSRQRVRGWGFVPGARDYAIRLWDLGTRREIRRFVGHQNDVTSLAFCPNGRHFLSASGDKTVRLWDLASGALLRTYRGHSDFIRSVAIAPDGRAAVSGGDDCTIRYWRLPLTAEELILALDKKSRADLTAAMRDLDTMGPELRAAFPKLVQTLGRGDQAMGELALTILRRLGQPDKEWVGGLREMLLASLPEARLFAAKALAQLGTDAGPAVVELRRALSDADRDVRRNAVTALANIGAEAREAQDDLGRLVEVEKDDQIRTEAIHALGKTGGTSQLKQLFRAAKEAPLLLAVLDTLAGMDGLDRSMVDQLLTSQGLRHTDAAVRSKALDCLRRLGLETLPITVLAELNLEDANRGVRNQAAKVLRERMGELTDRDLKDVRALLEKTGKPEAVRIGLEAVKHLGSRAKEVLPELLKRLPAAEAGDKLPLALALVAIDATNDKVVEAVSPILVAALRPQSKDDQPSEAVLKAIGAIGQPIVADIFKALDAADGSGATNAASRKALFRALQRLGRKAYSEDNAQVLRRYWKKERYRDVQAEAGKALHDMLPP